MVFVSFLIDGMMMMKFFNFDKQNVKALTMDIKLLKQVTTKSGWASTFLDNVLVVYMWQMNAIWQIIYF
jgi:hypothetical protein